MNILEKCVIYNILVDVSVRKFMKCKDWNKWNQILHEFYKLPLNLKWLNNFLVPQIKFQLLSFSFYFS